jgi:hypothetical protein
MEAAKGSRDGKWQSVLKIESFLGTRMQWSSPETYCKIAERPDTKNGSNAQDLQNR